MTDPTTPGDTPADPTAPGPDETPPGPAAPQGTTTTQPPTGQPRPVFRRSSTDKVIGGVAGGLARTFEQDPVVVRIITVVLALAFPPAFVAYLVAWLLVARDDEPTRSTGGAIAFRESGGILFWIGVVVLGGAFIASFDDPFNGGFGLLPLVLIGIGIALWTRDGDRRTTTPTTWPTATTTGAAMPAPQTPPAAPPAAGGPTPPAQPPAARPTSPQPPAAGPPPPPRPKSPLGAISIGLALIATGIVAALDQVDGIPIDADPSHLAAVALLVLGLGQLVGALWGRARWLSLVAIFLIPPVVLGAVVREVDAEWGLDIDELQIADGVGERVVRATGASDLSTDEVALLAGSIVVDLEDWQPTTGQRSVLEGDDDLTIDVGAGEVEITTPTDVPWRLVGEVRLGEIEVRDDDGLVSRLDSEGTSGNSLDVQLSGGPQDGEVLDIVVDVRLGQLTVITPAFDTQELS